MNCRDCLHFKACYEMATANNADEFNTMFAEKCEDFTNRSEWVHLPSDEYTFTVRGDIAKGLIISNCRAAERSIGNEQNRIEEFKKVKQIIKNLYPQASLGIFNTRNWCGDLTINIFSGEHFEVDICYQCEYFEVFGTTDEEWTELERLYEELTND